MLRVGKLLVAAAVCGLVMVAGPEARADDFPIQFSGNVTIASDYVWRGRTQNDNHPAIQGGFDTEWNGFYTGVWGSTVDLAGQRYTGPLANDASAQFDLYGGFGHDINEWLSVDAGFVSHQYSGMSDSHFEEAYGGLGFTLAMLEIGATYTFGVGEGSAFAAPDGTASAGDDLDVSVSTELLGFGLGAGWGDYDNSGSRASASISRSFAGVDWGVAYISFDGNEDADPMKDVDGEDTWVFSASKSL
jgi:uncharacterized protein (TIGR02001 family)